jgi:hypothetical protein
MVGDTSEALALNLSKLEGQAGRFDEALAVCRRLIDERGREVSPYNLAEIWNQMAWLYWRKGERERGLEVVREGIERYGATVRGDELRHTLAAFERDADDDVLTGVPYPTSHGDPGRRLQHVAQPLLLHGARALERRARLALASRRRSLRRRRDESCEGRAHRRGLRNAEGAAGGGAARRHRGLR